MILNLKESKLREMTKHSFLNDEFYEKYYNLIDWGLVCKYQKLSEDQIRKYRMYIDLYGFYNISRYQILSEEFMEEFGSSLAWEPLSIFQIMSDKFKKKHADQIIFDRPVLSTSILDKELDIHNGCIFNSVSLMEKLNKEPSWNALLESLNIRNHNDAMFETAEKYNEKYKYSIE